MENSELKELIVNSLDSNADPAEASNRLQAEGVSFSFSDDFVGRVLDAVTATGLIALNDNDNEIAGSIRTIFYRIAIGGIAAILILFVSIVLSEGSFSLNSLLGLSNTYDESIISLLTGK